MRISISAKIPLKCIAPTRCLTLVQLFELFSISLSLQCGQSPLTSASHSAISPTRTIVVGTYGVLCCAYLIVTPLNPGEATPLHAGRLLISIVDFLVFSSSTTLNSNER